MRVHSDDQSSPMGAVPDLRDEDRCVSCMSQMLIEVGPTEAFGEKVVRVQARVQARCAACRELAARAQEACAV